MSKLAPYVFWQSLDDDGYPLSGGKIYTYDAGTTIEKETYTDANESAQNPNPIILDADGRADIWLASGAYKFIVKDANDVLVDEADDIIGDASNVFGSSVVDISTNTNINSSYEKNVLDCSSSVTLSLLDASTAEEGFVFTVKNSSSGNVTIDPDGSELIDGNATLVLYPSQSVLIDCTGTAWISLYQDVVALPADNTFTGKFSLLDAGELTISSGAIAITASSHRVDSEGDAAIDDLDTISGFIDGGLLILRSEDDARVITVKHNTGNISTPDGNDLTLDSTAKTLTLQYDETNAAWLVISYSWAVLDEDDFASNSDVSLATQQSIKAYTDSKSVLSSPVATTSGTSHPFTGIPAGTKKITVGIMGVSTNGTSPIILQIGDSGGLETTGYLGSTTNIGTSSSNLSTGFTVAPAVGAGSMIHGSLFLTLMDSSTNTWVISGGIGHSDVAQNQIVMGEKSLSDTLTQLTLTTANGTDAFDAGKINVLYEA